MEQSPPLKDYAPSASQQVFYATLRFIAKFKNAI
jgi:hypothetical protein